MAFFSKIVVNKQSGISIILMLMSVILLAGCGYVYRSGFVRVPRQPISGPVEIGPEWIELIPPSPLIPYGAYQSVLIGIEGYDSLNYVDDVTKGDVLNFTDGRKSKIEAFVYDDKDEPYELQITGTGGEGGGVRFGRKWTTDIVEGRPESILPQFPIDRTYMKLRIRSSMPIKCDRILWVGINHK